MLRFRTLLSALAGLLLLTAVIAGIAISQIDKQATYMKIAELVAQHSDWRLSPEGQLDWSLLPLGLKIDQLRLAHIDQKQAIAADTLVLKLAWLPLLTGTLQVTHLSALRPDIRLVTSPPSDQEQTPLASDDDAAQKQTATSDDESSTLELALDALAIDNGVIVIDHDSPQSLTISNLFIRLDQWRDQAFAPLSIKAMIEHAALPNMISASLSTSIKTELNSASVELANLSGRIDATENDTPHLLPLTFDGALRWDGQSKLLNSPSLNVMSQAVSIKSSVDGSFKNDMQVRGAVELSVNRLADLITELGGPANMPLQRSRLNANITLQQEQARIALTKWQIDDSTWQGETFFDLSAQRYQAMLSGDTLDLRPWLNFINSDKSDNDQTRTKQSKSQDQLSAADATKPNLPEIDLEAKLAIAQIMLPRGTIQNTSAHLTHQPHQASTLKLSAALAEGTVQAQARLDHTRPPWQSTLTAQLDQLSLEALNNLAREQNTPVQGRASGTLRVKALGHTTDALIQSATGKGELRILQGQVEGINLHHLMCLTYAQINRETLQTNSWPEHTAFESLDTQFALDQGTFTLTALSLNSATLTAEGSAKAQLTPADLSANVAIRASGAHPDPACRVHPRITRLPLPATCSGSWSPPDVACKVDSKTLKSAVKDIAKDEAQRKAEKELDRALDKKLGGDEQSKDAVKSLLKKLLK
ncbi:MAG: AsmA family protein [Oleiphilaceae bacterium]|nr:AsmA family protein [Oleiphilaceae bacterium]